VAGVKTIRRECKAGVMFALPEIFLVFSSTNTDTILGASITGL
jgi:hypothetical protein